MVDEFVEGQVLDGKYRIERVIGRGGMGIVVAARHLVLDERVAIKFLLSEQAWMNGEVVARFEREARAAVKIKSEHVVRVIDVGRLASGAPYMVMEFLQGEDLSARLAERGPLPIEQAADFVLHACVALAGAHAAGIVHRDIKPGNLFCTQGGDGEPLVKVLDFGISKLTEAAQRGDGLSVTKTAAVLGSPLYMSPEQIRSSKDVDLRTDIWSLGVVLFELVAGQVPFPGESFGEVAIKIATLPVPPLAQFRRDAPPGLDAVIARCLAKERDQRYPNMGGLALALAPYASVRGQATVARISRLSQSGPISTGAFALTEPANSYAPARSAANPQPAALSGSGPTSLSGSGQRPNALPETAAAWGATGEHRAGRRALVGTTAVVTLGLAIAGAVLFRHNLMPGAEASASSAVTPPPPLPIATGTPSGVERVVTVAPVPSPAPVVTTAPPSASVAPAATEAADSAEPAAPDALPGKRLAPARHAGRSVTPAPVPTHTTAPVPLSVPSPSPAPAPRPPEPARPTPAPEPAAARPSTPKPDCDPPYVLDDQGRKRFKPECFK
jgi:serine/threonine-protein kinase